jgi:CheY-like chemotaxis protein
MQMTMRGSNMATILVTDDDIACRETILKTLEREGHILQGACDVDAAIKAVKQQQFDLIVCDYRMPGKTGLDLLQELSALGSHVPVLMVSAFADSQTEEAVSTEPAPGVRGSRDAVECLDHLTLKPPISESLSNSHSKVPRDLETLSRFQASLPAKLPKCHDRNSLIPR